MADPLTTPNTNRLRSLSTLLVAPQIPPTPTIAIRYVGILCFFRPAMSGESEGDRYNQYIEI